MHIARGVPPLDEVEKYRQFDKISEIGETNFTEYHQYVCMKNKTIFHFI